MYYSWNLVKIPRFSSSSSSVSYLALGIPTFSLLVTLYIGVFFPKQSSILSSIDCFCYTKIYLLNSSILSYSCRLSNRSLTSSYFLTNILTFRSLGWTLYLPKITNFKLASNLSLAPALVQLGVRSILILS